MSQPMPQPDANHRSPEYPPVADPGHPHPEEPKKVTTKEVRQATDVRGMSTVLIVSITLVVLGFLAVSLWA
jgi:hypothetical protein